MTETLPCRCGWEGSGEHPCHGGLYTCHQPGKRRLYDIHFVSLPGMTFKVEVRKQTVACDACWEKFEQLLRENA